MEFMLTCALYLLAGGLVLAVAHLWLLAIVGLLPRKGRTSLCGSAPLFLIIVPAHNEEQCLPATLRSLRSLDYPPERYRIWVVADNCTDETAAVARKWGAHCIERNDPTRRGKGYALKTAFDRAVATDSDAVVVIDADTVVSPRLLQEFSRRMTPGLAALQTSCRLAAQGGPWSIWLAIENTLEDRLFYRAKERLGCPTSLRGTGMCFSLDLLRLVPFRCFSVTEDVKYTVQLLKAGIRPRFVPDTAVVSACPTTLSQIAQQRQRWSAGHFRTALREAPGLFVRGLVRRDLRLCEFAFSMLITSKTVLAGLSAIGLVVSLAAHQALGFGMGPAWLFAVALAAICAYFLVGLVLYRPAPADLIRLAGLPLLVVWRFAIHLMAAFSHRRAVWVRTSRS